MGFNLLESSIYDLEFVFYKGKNDQWKETPKEDEYNKIKYYQIKVNKAVPKNIAENINKVIKVNTHGVKQVFDLNHVK